jgi:hypothetical protein
MPNLVVRSRDGRELQISDGNFIFLKDQEGEVNWEWQYLEDVHSDVEASPHRAEAMIHQVKDLLPDNPVGRIK